MTLTLILLYFMMYTRVKYTLKFLLNDRNESEIFYVSLYPTISRINIIFNTKSSLLNLNNLCQFQDIRKTFILLERGLYFLFYKERQTE